MTNQPPPRPSHDEISQAALAELAQLGRNMVGVSARLVELEQQAADLLAAKIARDAADPSASNCEAMEAIRQADLRRAARIAARLASAKAMRDKMARSVRLTEALRARLAGERPAAPARERAAPRVAVGRFAFGQPVGEAERLRLLGRSDELDGRSDEQVVRDICRNLAASKQR